MPQYKATPVAAMDGQQTIPLTDEYGRFSVNVAATALPTGAATAAKQDAEAVLIGAVNETPPVTDTGSAGLNGMLKRIAQRLTTLITAIGTFAYGLGVATAALRIVSASTAATDRSGTITSGGTAQNAMASNTSRRGWAVVNNSDTEMRVHPAGTASSTAGIPLNYGEMASGDETNAISIHGATTGKAFTAWEN